ncbi:aminoacyl-tRNA hydrolase [Natranaerobius thermophilus]|nr:aminoacyl-tRNA hydrolase [Natranaerobius thermophilus]
MKLIAGLGNPGKKYQYNKHNIGFMVIDYFAKQHGLSVTKLKHQSMWDELRLEGEKIVLIKPLTYMNRSGHAIKLWKDYFKIENQDLLIIYDDLDLELGDLRMRPKGGTGGHNGLKSIVSTLGGKEFPRIRFGIGRPASQESTSSYVLKDFTKKEFETINNKFPDLSKGIELFCKEGINEAMNFVNSLQN